MMTSLPVIMYGVNSSEPSQSLRNNSIKLMMTSLPVIMYGVNSSEPSQSLRNNSIKLMMTTLPVIMDDVNPSEPDVKGSGKKIAQAAEHLKIQPPGDNKE